MILCGLLSVCFLSEEDVGDVMTHRRQEYGEYYRRARRKKKRRTDITRTFLRSSESFNKDREKE